MQYEPIKKFLARFFRRSPFLRKLLYFLLDLLLLRSWHVRKAINSKGRNLPGDAAVLDAGSGFGQYAWRMSSIFTNWKITGIDINSDDADDCNRFFMSAGRSGRVSFRQGDLTLLDERGIYNLIITVDVMEHIGDDEKVFSNFCNALKDNGILIISTPSDKGGSDVHDHEGRSFIDEHVRDGYSKEEITGKLLKSGFSTVEIKYTYGKAGNLSWRLSMKYPVKMVNTSRIFFLILPFYYLITFPLAFVLNIIDANMMHESGTGLLVIAEKKS